MSPKRFWRSTPAQLNILSSVHAEINNPRGSKKVAKTIEEAGIDI
jgi:hypothetical protein